MGCVRLEDATSPDATPIRKGRDPPMAFRRPARTDKQHLPKTVARTGPSTIGKSIDLDFLQNPSCPGISLGDVYVRMRLPLVPTPHTRAGAPVRAAERLRVLPHTTPDAGLTGELRHRTQERWIGNVRARENKRDLGHEPPPSQGSLKDLKSAGDVSRPTRKRYAPRRVVD